MTETTELKPCPFCGGEATISQYGNLYKVKCGNLGTCPAIPKLFELYSTVELAAEVWNRRASYV